MSKNKRSDEMSKNKRSNKIKIDINNIYSREKGKILYNWLLSEVDSIKNILILKNSDDNSIQNDNALGIVQEVIGEYDSFMHERMELETFMDSDYEEKLSDTQRKIYWRMYLMYMKKLDKKYKEWYKKVEEYMEKTMNKYDKSEYEYESESE